MPRLSSTLFLLALSVGLSGCKPNGSSSPTATHPVEKPKVEADLRFVTLSKKARDSLAIEVKPVSMEEVQESLSLTGWIMAKPGNEVTMTAPAAGYVRLAPGREHAPIAGERVVGGVELLTLEPVLTPLDQIQLATLKRSVEGELSKAKASMITATAEDQRIRELFAQKLRSEQDVQQAHKALDHAKEDLAAATDKLKLFVTTRMPLLTPRDGMILALQASPGQYVAAAAPVATIIDLRSVWLRVPVPEYDLPSVDGQQKIVVTFKNDHGGTPKRWFTARPTGRVAQVDPLRHTADFWYELAAEKDPLPFVKDQMVTAQVPQNKVSQAVVAPYAAVVFDMHGNSWIYVERTNGSDKLHKYVRQRVELGAPYRDGLIVGQGLTGGERVVTAGAAKLFSREFHKTPVADDDDD